MGNGNFVWFDLISADSEGSKRFYSEIIGWKVKRWAGSDYEMWTAGENDVGGIVKAADDPLGAGKSPMWLGYASVENVDASVSRAQKLGGKVVTPGQEIPNVGRWATVADPQGAVFALFQPNEKVPEVKDASAPGTFGWAELNTTDWKSAWKFYAELLGWQRVQSMNMGPELGEYFMFGPNGKDSIGGMSNASKMMKAPPHWLYYVNVKSVEETAKRIPTQGGKVLNGPMDIPAEGGGGKIAQCMDPQGAMFAIVNQPR